MRKLVAVLIIVGGLGVAWACFTWWSEQRTQKELQEINKQEKFDTCLLYFIYDLAKANDSRRLRELLSCMRGESPAGNQTVAAGAKQCDMSVEEFVSRARIHNVTSGDSSYTYLILCSETKEDADRERLVHLDVLERYLEDAKKTRRISDTQYNKAKKEIKEARASIQK